MTVRARRRLFRARAVPGQARRLWWSVLDVAITVRLHARVLLLPRIPRAFASGDADRPVVLMIPGVYEQWWFLERYARALSDEGFRVRFVGGLGYNLRDIVGTAERLERALGAHPTPVAGRIIVAHSKGGLIGKALLRRAGARLGLHGVVAVASPFQGSRLAARQLDPRLRAFRPDDETIVELGRDAAVNQRIVSVFGRFDSHIPDGSSLADATNVPTSATGHMTILRHEGATDAVVDAVLGIESAARDGLTPPGR